MCDRSRSMQCYLTQIIAILDIDTAMFAYHMDLAKAKASAEFASVIHDALVKYTQSFAKADAVQNVQQPWVPDDAFPTH